MSSDITGTLKWYGGGGGGGVNHNGNKQVENGGGAGGKGGGGKGSDFASKTRKNNKKFTGTSGEKNTGGGGGGTDPECKVAGKGGSGIVVVRYKSMKPLLTGGTITTSDGCLGKICASCRKFNFHGAAFACSGPNRGDGVQTLNPYTSSLLTCPGYQIHTFSTVGTDTLKF